MQSKVWCTTEFSLLRLGGARFIMATCYFGAAITDKRSELNTLLSLLLLEASSICNVASASKNMS